MQKALTLHQTSVGKKAILAVTGVILYGFVIGHMIGNLQVFLGPAKLNAYAVFLHSLPSLLWLARITLLLSLVAHVATAMQLNDRNAYARQSRYHGKRDVVTNYAAKTMMLSGPILALFIAFHLMHLTAGWSMSSSYAHSATDVYANVINGFSVPWVTAIYIVANLLLGLHLYHGVWSVFQSVGLAHPRYNPQRRWFATAIAVLVTAGNVAMPTAVLAGWVS